MDLTAVSSRKETALSYASECGHLEVVQFLKKIVSERLGKSVFQKMLNSKDEYGRTSLFSAAAYKKTKVVEFLMALEECEYKIARVKDGFTPLHIAAKEGHLQVVKSLLEAPRLSKDEKM